MSVTPSRRERLRAATVEEILATARKLLVDEGLAGVTLRAIGREMGMTAPALYRYFDSLDSLLEALCAELYHECTDYIESRLAEVPPDDLTARLAAASRAFRRWSMTHPAEFALMFANPAVGGKRDAGAAGGVGGVGVAHEAGMRFARVFFAMFVGLWQRAPFPVPAAEEMDPRLVADFQEFLAAADTPLPPGVVQVFVSCWIRLYGLVALEVYGHLHFALQDGEPMFEAELAAAAAQLGLQFPPPPKR